MGNILLYSDKQNLLSEMTPIVVPFLTNQEFMKLQISCVAWADDVDPLCGMLCHIEARICTQYRCALLSTGMIHTRVNPTEACV